MSDLEREKGTAVPLSDEDLDAPIEAGNDSDFSGYSTASGTDATQSVTSSVRDYVYDNGRRYHRYGGEGKYMLPNDETEQDRLDLQHHASLILHKGFLHIAPVKNAQRVLDCGTGTGIWALDFGDVHPEAEVIGVDLSPIQPSWVFPNVKFEVDDLDQDWTYPENHFDFIHSRNIATGIKDFARLVKQAYRHTTPGGWVEFAEWHHQVTCKDDTMGPQAAVTKIRDVFDEATAKMGLDVPDGEKIKGYLEEAGFEEVQIRTFWAPWGPWPKNPRLKQLGGVLAVVSETGFEAYALQMLTRVLGWEAEKAKELCRNGSKEIISGKVHLVQPVYHVIGRKPLKK